MTEHLAARPRGFDPTAEMLQQAEATGDAKLVQLVARARALIEQVRARFNELEDEREAAAEVERLAADLAAARDRLRKVKGGAPTPTRTAGRSARIRAWAATNGHDVRPLGVIPRAVVKAYETATGDRDG